MWQRRQKLLSICPAAVSGVWSNLEHDRLIFVFVNCNARAMDPCVRVKVLQPHKRTPIDLVVLPTARL